MREITKRRNRVQKIISNTIILVVMGLIAMGFMAAQDINPETKMVTKIIEHDALK